MRERPILFSAPMVRAILEGRKTQTRRIVKPPRGYEMPCEPLDADDIAELLSVCPYGQPGDRLWLKETWRPWLWAGGDSIETAGDVEIEYAADGMRRHLPEAPSEWVFPKTSARGNVSPLFMPRWASRITLEVTDVRVERLQDISEADAIAEGSHDFWGVATPWKDRLAPVPVHGFAALWESVNGAGSWDANPWVWVVSFQRVTA